MAVGAINQVHESTGGYPFSWSFGGGTAMMLQIGHRESHDVDIFIDDHQILGFFNPDTNDLKFEIPPTENITDGNGFQKFVSRRWGRSISSSLAP